MSYNNRIPDEQPNKKRVPHWRDRDGYTNVLGVSDVFKLAHDVKREHDKTVASSTSAAPTSEEINARVSHVFKIDVDRKAGTMNDPNQQYNQPGSSIGSWIHYGDNNSNNMIVPNVVTGQVEQPK